MWLALFPGSLQEEFYKYLTRVDLAETDDQIVSRYIGGLQQNIQDPLNLFDPINVFAAHQKALLFGENSNQGIHGVFLGVAQRVPRLDTMGRLHLETPPNQQI
jgi:hypothetical protein